jgi:hypothetical protein
MFGPIRKQELDVLVKSLEKAAFVSEVVNVSEFVLNLIKDIVYKMILGRSKQEQFDLKKLVQEGSLLIGAFNMADYVPWLGVFVLGMFVLLVCLRNKRWSKIYFNSSLL